MEKKIGEITGSEVPEFNLQSMGKYYENLEKILSLIKKLEKKHLLAEFIQDVIMTAKKNPEMSFDDIIETSKKKWLK